MAKKTDNGKKGEVFSVITLDDWLGKQQKLFRESREAVNNQILKQFEIAGQISEVDTSLCLSFLRDCGVSDEDVPTFVKFPSVFASRSSTLDGAHVTFGVIKALVNTDATTRHRLLEYIEAGITLSEREIAESGTKQRLREISDDAFVLHQGETSLEEASQKFAAQVRDELRQDSRRLLRMMLAYNCDRLTDTNPLHREIVELAGTTLSRFEALFGKEHAKLEDWYVVGLTKKAAQNLAQCHYALEQISNEKFDYFFPHITSEYYSWSAFDAINYIAGLTDGIDDNRQRNHPRPVRRLSAVDLCANGGGQALGLEAAGFHIRRLHEVGASNSLESLKHNRGDWPLSVIDLRHEANRGDFIASLSKMPRLGLLSGSLPRKPWGRLGNGVKDDTDLLKYMLDLVDGLKPRAFYFETDPHFHTTRHVKFRNDFISRAESLGYRIDIVDLDAARYGVPQGNRLHTFIIGIEAASWPNYVSPLKTANVRNDIVNAIGNIAFPMRSDFSASGEIPRMEGSAMRSAEQKTYDDFAEAWLDNQRNACAPDLRKLDEIPIDPWLSIGMTTLFEPHNVAKGARKLKYLPITAPILMRLQGMPDDWELKSQTETEQRKEIARLTPPYLALAIARRIRAALTGEDIDHASPGALAIRSGKKPAMAASLAAASDNPEAFMAYDWKQMIEEEYRQLDDHLWDIWVLPDTDEDPIDLDDSNDYEDTVLARETASSAKFRFGISK